MLNQVIWSKMKRLIEICVFSMLILNLLLMLIFPQVTWCMDVICFGLSLPLTEHETIKDCVNVYCEWMTALHPQPRISVPKPICENANMYCRKIISHFHNLFVPRQGESKCNLKKKK